MTVEYAAIWRAWQLTQADMERLRYRSAMRRIGRDITLAGPSFIAVGVAAGALGKRMIAAAQAAQIA